MWAAIHGTVMLHQAAMLKHGPDHRALLTVLAANMLQGAAPAKPMKSTKRSRR
jgi:hypothetical protein